jgi:hypothetical protein
VTHQWRRATDAAGSGAQNIIGATGLSYTLTVADAHQYVGVTETATDSGTPAPGLVATAATGWGLVGKGDQTIAFDALSVRTYGDADFAAGATATSGLAVSYASSNPAVATVAGSNLHIVGFGTTTITASQDGDTNWNVAAAVPQDFTVKKAGLTVVAAAAERPYGAANPAFSGTLTGVVAGDAITATYASAAVPATPAGVYGPATAEAIIPALADPGTRLGNYEVTPTNGTLTIGKAVLTVVAAAADRPYGAANPVFSGTLTGVVAGDAITATYASAAGPTTPAGAYGPGTAAAIIPVLADPGARLGNYEVTKTSGTLTIGKATPGLTWLPPASIESGIVLGGAQLNAAATIPGSFTYAPSAGTVLTRGIHTLTVTFTPDDVGNWVTVGAERSIEVVAATPPLVTALTPPDGTVGVAHEAVLSVTFNEAVFAGPGDIRIMNADGSVFESIPVEARGTVAIVGQNVSITPARLVAGSAYYVLIDGTCFYDAVGNAFAGITDATTWRFTARQWGVRFAAAGAGALEGQTMQGVDHGKHTTVPVLAVANYGYVFERWDDAAAENRDNPRTVKNVLADRLLTASFRPVSVVVAPDGDFEARMGAAGVAAGTGLWDLSGTYGAAVAGDHLGLDLTHDTGGRLVGSATYTVTKAAKAAKDATVSMPVRGSVRGRGNAVVVSLAMWGANPAGTISVSLALNLTVDLANHQLVGFATGSTRVDGTTTRVHTPVAFDIPEPMVGAWTLAFQLVQSSRNLTGQATLTLLHGAHYTYRVTGRVAGQAAVLTLSGDPSDPAARGIKISATAVTLEGRYARLDHFSCRGYGQTLVW